MRILWQLERGVPLPRKYVQSVTLPTFHETMFWSKASVVSKRRFIFLIELVSHEFMGWLYLLAWWNIRWTFVTELVCHESMF